MAEIFIFNQQGDTLLTVLSEGNGLISAYVHDVLNDVSSEPLVFSLDASATYEYKASDVGAGNIGDTTQLASMFIGPSDKVAPSSEDLVNTAPAQYVRERNRAVIKDRNGDFREYVITEIDDYDDFDGATSTATCIPAWQAELSKRVIEDKRYVDTTPNRALSDALERTRYEGVLTHTFGNATTNFYRISSAEALWRIMEAWGGEFKDSVTLDGYGRISHRTITINQRRGQDNGARFEVDYNMPTIERTILSDPVTAMYGWGASLEIEDSEGAHTGGYTRYIDFKDVEWSKAAGDPADKPLGQAWVGDVDARSNYGIRIDGQLTHLFGQFSNQDYVDPEELLKAAWDHLQDVKDAVVKYKMTVDEIDRPVALGDDAVGIDREFSRPIEVKSRVIGIRYNMLDLEEPATVEMGQFLGVDNILSNEIDEIKREQEIVRATANQAVQSADGKNTNYRGADEPTGDLKEGDLWFKIVDGEYTSTYRYDGSEWRKILDMDSQEAKESAQDAKDRADDAYERANKGVSDAQEAFDKAQENADEVDSLALRIGDNEDNITTITGIAEGLQLQVEDNEDNIATLTITSEVFQSVLGGIVDKRNMVPFMKTGNFTTGGNETDTEGFSRSPFIEVSPGTWYTFSRNGSLRSVLLMRYDSNKNFITYSNESSYYVPSNTRFIRFSIRYPLDELGDMQMEKGSEVSSYVPYISDVSQSQISQLDDAVNLRVTKDDVINQINIDTSGVLISGKKLILDGDTTVNGSFKLDGSANIKDASIGTAQIGTIDAAQASIININVDDLVGNTSSFVRTIWNDITSQVRITGNGLETYNGGDRTSRLNGRGHEFFEDGRSIGSIGTARWHNDSNYRGLLFSLEKDSDYMTWAYRQTANGNPITMFSWHKNGSKSSKGFSFSDNVRISSDHRLSVYKLRTISSSRELDLSLLTHTWDGRTGISLRYGDGGGRLWVGTGSASLISSGNAYIEVGQDSTGNRVHSIDIHNRSYPSSSANVRVTQHGTLGRVTSSRRYKLLEEKIPLEQARKILDVDLKSWFDKRVAEEYAEQLSKPASDLDYEKLPIKRFGGFIAEDIHDAGLEMFVEYSDDKVPDAIASNISMLAFPLLKDHEGRITQLENEVTNLKQQIKELMEAS